MEGSQGIGQSGVVSIADKSMDFSLNYQLANGSRDPSVHRVGDSRQSVGRTQALSRGATYAVTDAAQPKEQLPNLNYDNNYMQKESGRMSSKLKTKFQNIQNMQESQRQQNIYNLRQKKIRGYHGLPSFSGQTPDYHSQNLSKISNAISSILGGGGSESKARELDKDFSPANHNSTGNAKGEHNQLFKELKNVVAPYDPNQTVRPINGSNIWPKDSQNLDLKNQDSNVGDNREDNHANQTQVLMHQQRQSFIPTSKAPIPAATGCQSPNSPAPDPTMHLQRQGMIIASTQALKSPKSSRTGQRRPKLIKIDNSKPPPNEEQKHCRKLTQSVSQNKQRGTQHQSGTSGTNTANALQRATNGSKTQNKDFTSQQKVNKQGQTKVPRVTYTQSSPRKRDKNDIFEKKLEEEKGLSSIKQKKFDQLMRTDMMQQQQLNRLNSDYEQVRFKQMMQLKAHKHTASTNIQGIMKKPTNKLGAKYMQNRSSSKKDYVDSHQVMSQTHRHFRSHISDEKIFIDGGTGDTSLVQIPKSRLSQAEMMFQRYDQKLMSRDNNDQCKITDKNSKSNFNMYSNNLSLEEKMAHQQSISNRLSQPNKSYKKNPASIIFGNGDQMNTDYKLGGGNNFSKKSLTYLWKQTNSSGNGSLSSVINRQNTYNNINNSAYTNKRGRDSDSPSNGGMYNPPPQKIVRFQLPSIEY